MGGRGAGGGSGGGGTGGIGNVDIVSTTSLISARERNREEVDRVLTVLRDVERDYGVILNDVQIATLKGKGLKVMAYYDADGNLAVNKNYFDNAKVDAAYDHCVDSGFHPSRGNKTGMEALTAHEIGHRLTDAAGERAGLGSWTGMDSVANACVRNAARSQGVNVSKLRSNVSGYAKSSNVEAVAEAFADVYCNGSRANASSRAIVTELNKYFGR